MIGDKSQSQISGDSSLNIQAQSISISGVSAGEARQIAIDVYRANFSALAQEAATTAMERATVLSDRLIDKLAKQFPETLSEFKQPGMQIAVLTAQREYARSGDKLVEDLLVSVLVDRAREKTRTLRQIAFDEALQIIPKLTDKQVDALTLNTLVNDQYFMARSEAGLKKYLGFLVQFKVALGFRSPNVSHLEFAGCVKQSTTSSSQRSLDYYLKNTYPGLFPKPFTKEHFEKTIPSPELFRDLLVPHGDAGLVRLNAISTQDINQFFSARGMENELKKPLFDLLRSSSLGFDDVKRSLVALQEGLEFVFSFDNHDLLRLELTPVGMAVACANFKRRIGVDLGWPYHMREMP